MNPARFIESVFAGLPGFPVVYADALITSYPYLLLECDEEGFEQEWLKILVHLHQPIVAMYTSGNVSVHALVRVDATSKQHFDEIAERYKRELCPLGACPGSLTATRATRLPGVVRGDNGREQRLAGKRDFERYQKLRASGMPQKEAFRQATQRTFGR